MKNKILSSYPWFIELPSIIDNYVESLKKPNKSFSYFPAEKGLTSGGSKLELGFSCYALKISHITNKFDTLHENEKNSWVDYINSFYKSDSRFGHSTFVDSAYIESIYKKNNILYTKYLVKQILNYFNLSNYENLDSYVQRSVMAETKQAVATLSDAGIQANYDFRDILQPDNGLTKYLKSQNWNTPWMAGAQFANICVFSSTSKLFNNEKYNIEINNFINNICDAETGTYFLGPKPSNRELINGSMKVISGFEWINKEINYPEKLIDFCLQSKISQEGCDLVDIVYVLYKCAGQTSYKRKEIANFLFELLDLIFLHFYVEKGGFSYFLKKSQTHYYGVKITRGTNNPDIHGTLLLLWSISMILEILEVNDLKLKVLKP
jgi:hypothetical protein